MRKRISDEAIEKQARERLTDIKSKLDEFHNRIYSGDNIHKDEIEGMLKDLRNFTIQSRDADEALTDLFIKYRDGFHQDEKKVSKAKGIAIIVGLVSLFVPVFWILLVVLLIKIEEMQSFLNKYDKFCIQESFREDIFVEIVNRIEFYREVLQVKLKKQELNGKQKSNNLEVANEWIGLAIAENINVDVIPLDIKSEMLRVLQFELKDYRSSLEELLNAVRNKNRQNIVERGRYIENR